MSYVNDFQRKIEEENLQKSSKRVITIDGLSGAGKGTLSKQIGEIMDLPVYSAGDFFRSIADERGLMLHELEQQADKETDMEVDRRTLKKGLNESCVIESRIASRVLGDYSDLRIRLKASLEERARRIKGRKNEESLENVKERIRKRDEENWRRYQSYYGLEDGHGIYHLMVDNTEMGLDQQRKVFRAFLNEWFT